MKKILILAIAVSLSALANAASVNWKLTSGNMYAKDGTSKYTGTFELYASGGDLESALVVYSVDSVVNGTLANVAFSTTDLTVGESYDFYYVLKDGDYTFTSAAKTAGAAETGASNINFGNQASATQATGAWSAVPEPTSGLLLLLGVAGLALKRKRA